MHMLTLVCFLYSIKAVEWDSCKHVITYTLYVYYIFHLNTLPFGTDAMHSGEEDDDVTLETKPQNYNI